MNDSLSMKNDMGSTVESGQNATKPREISTMWPFVYCKACKDLERVWRIWLPYRPDDPYRSNPKAEFVPLNLVCGACKHFCQYGAGDLQWTERDAPPIPVSVMMCVMLRCKTSEKCAPTRVNVVIPLSWNDPPSWQVEESRLIAQVPEWIPHKETCPAGHSLKLDGAGLRFTVNPCW